MNYMQESSHNNIKTGQFTGHTSLLFWAESKIPVSITTAARNQFANLLPDKNVQDNLVRNWAVIASRAITKYLPPFQSFQDVVFRHIPHANSKEMSEKSKSVGLIPVTNNHLLCGNFKKFLYIHFI